MKNLFLALGFVVVLASCSSTEEKTETVATDSAAVATATVTVDSCAAKCDTTAVATPSVK